VAPGGGYEAQLGTTDYKVMWKKRSGFAIIAIQVLCWFMLNRERLLSFFVLPKGFTVK
jgi:hypothetical protein